MLPFEYISMPEMVIDENGSLQQFYQLADELSRNKKVQFTGKSDDADNIVWCFKYRGNPLCLQYNIYSGLSLLNQGKDLKTANQLVLELKAKTV